MDVIFPKHPSVDMHCEDIQKREKKETYACFVGCKYSLLLPFSGRFMRKRYLFPSLHTRSYLLLKKKKKKKKERGGRGLNQDRGLLLIFFLPAWLRLMFNE